MKRPLVIPAVIAIGLVVFVAGMVATGSSIEEVRGGKWLLGSFDSAILWKTWTLERARRRRLALRARIVGRRS